MASLLSVNTFSPSPAKWKGTLVEMGGPETAPLTGSGLKERKKKTLPGDEDVLMTSQPVAFWEVQPGGGEEAGTKTNLPAVQPDLFQKSYIPAWWNGPWDSENLNQGKS